MNDLWLSIFFMSYFLKIVSLVCLFLLNTMQFQSRFMIKCEWYIYIYSLETERKCVDLQCLDKRNI